MLNLCDYGNDGDVYNIPIRTLCVGPIKADMEGQIKRYFEQFGTVNAIEIEQGDDSHTHFALVEFKLVETAAAAQSSNGVHRINGCDVEVKAAEPCQQPDHILNSLDDHCLRMILLHLKQSDLFNAADVCVRFNQQAKSVFFTKFKKLNIIKCTYENAKRLIRNFGSVAQSIDIKSEFIDEDEMQILSTIAQCCTSVLKELTLRKFVFDAVKLNDLGVKFDSVLKNLQSLVLIDCDLRHSLNDILSVCGELKMLHLEGGKLSLKQSTWSKMNKLEELRLANIEDLDTVIMDGIVVLGLILKKLSIIAETIQYKLKYDVKPSEAIRTILLYFPNLQEFGFDVTPGYNTDIQQSVRCLDRLKSLKVLKLNLRYNWFALKTLPDILTVNAIPIEHLKVRQGMIDSNTIKAITQMKQLKILELDGILSLTNQHIIELAKGLGTQLEKLHLIGDTAQDITTIGLKKMLPFAPKLSHLTLKSLSITINMNDHVEMLRIVQERPEKVALLLELTSAGGQVYGNDAIFTENRNIFRIKEKFDLWLYKEKNGLFDDDDDEDGNASSDDSSMNYDSDDSSDF